jgi:hypothetical protein
MLGAACKASLALLRELICEFKNKANIKFNFLSSMVEQHSSKVLILVRIQKKII